MMVGENHDEEPDELYEDDSSDTGSIFDSDETLPYMLGDDPDATLPYMLVNDHDQTVSNQLET